MFPRMWSKCYRLGEDVMIFDLKKTHEFEKEVSEQGQETFPQRYDSLVILRAKHSIKKFSRHSHTLFKKLPKTKTSFLLRPRDWFPDDLLRSDFCIYSFKAFNFATLKSQQVLRQKNHFWTNFNLSKKVMVIIKKGLLSD